MGVAAWLVETHIEYGVLNTTTLQQIGPALTGGCFSLFTSLIITVLLSFLYPQDYDWANMKDIAVFNDISADVRSGPSYTLASSYFCGITNVTNVVPCHDKPKETAENGYGCRIRKLHRRRPHWSF